MPELDGKRILIIDDKVELLELVRLHFARAGAEVHTATGGEEGLRLVYDLQPDLVILDVMMPGMDGWTTCTRIRQICDVPIIFLTALAGDEQTIRGLDLGAVDYVTKPFSAQVLLARARAALRQAALGPNAKRPVAYDDGYLAISLHEGQVQVGGEPVELTATEFRLLGYLLQNAGRVLTHEEILEQAWGPEYQDSANYVHVYVRRLRQKLEKDPSQPEYLHTHRGVGYRFEVQTP